MSIPLNVNGTERIAEVPDDTPLLYVLRDEFGLNGAKYGCGYGQCGACAVLVDGVPARSCIEPVAGLAGRTITTLEGLRGPDGGPHALQTAFLKEQAGQCGYCLSGMIISAAALLAESKDPSESEIRAALDGNLCRCGSHNRIVRAVARAAKEAAQ